MNKIYNTQEEIASKIVDFLKKAVDNIRKTQLNILPFIVIGMIISESTVASDIAKNLKDDFSLIQHESVIKRIKRFFSNKLFKPYDFYDKIIRYVISTYKKKHSDKRVHIIFDHMFSHDNFTVFMMSMRIGKQGIPLWFRCFKGNNDTCAFDENLIKEGIDYIDSLFTDDFDLIILADRWFNSTSIFQHIDSLGHTYCVRLKRNIKAFVYDKKQNDYVWKTVSDLQSYEYHANWYNDVLITDHEHKVNIAISQRHGVKEHWIIATNGDPKLAIKDYGYRYGGIECLFKSQKSNGLYMESTVNCSLDYFTSMYTICCFTTLFLMIFGADFSKNSDIYKNTKLTTHKIINGKRKRVLSYFNIGLTLFHLAYNSLRYIRIPFSFTLYDI